MPMPNRTIFAASGSPKDNRLLAALPSDGYDALLPFLERLTMPLGLSVYESGGTQDFFRNRHVGHPRRASRGQLPQHVLDVVRSDSEHFQESTNFLQLLERTLQFILARFCSVTSMTVPVNSTKSPVSLTTGWPILWTSLMEPSGRTSR